MLAADFVPGLTEAFDVHPGDVGTSGDGTLRILRFKLGDTAYWLSSVVLDRPGGLWAGWYGCPEDRVTRINSLADLVAWASLVRVNGWSNGWAKWRRNNDGWDEAIIGRHVAQVPRIDSNNAGSLWEVEERESGRIVMSGQTLPGKAHKAALQVAYDLLDEGLKCR